MSERTPLARDAGALVLVALLAYGLVSSIGLWREWDAGVGGAVLLLGWMLPAGWALSTARRDLRRGELVAFLLYCAALRLGVLALASGRTPRGDAFYYPELAANLIAGHGLVMVEPFMGVACRALYPPLYPIVLAGWGAVAGLSPASLIMLETVIDAATALMIVALGRRLGAGRAGPAAALLYLAWPSVVLAAPFAAKEGLVTLLVAALAIGWLDGVAAERVGWRHRLGIGVPAGLLALTQPGVATLAALIGLALLPRAGWRRIMGVGLPAAACAVAVMLPWWVRNAVVLHAFVPLTSASGYSLWVGNNPDATGNWLPPPPELRGLPEIAFGHAAGHLAMQWIAAHPVAFVHLTIAKFLRASAIGVAGVARLAGTTPAPPAAVAALLVPVAQGAHLLLLGASAVAVRVRGNPAMLRLLPLLAAGLVQLLVFDVWFEFAERHREFLTPLLLAATTAYAGRHVTRRTAPAVRASVQPAL